MRRKSFLNLVFITAFLFICASGCSSNILSNSANSSTTTTTVPTTLSEEEILKNRIKDINEDVINGLKEKYNFLDAKYVGYVNFQDYISGAESNPSEYFFLGTSMYDISKLYDNTKFYKNCDVLENLKNWGFMNADYLFEYLTIKKDVYGKEEEKFTFVLVLENEDDTFTFWVFDCYDDSYEDFSLQYMIMSAVVDKCNLNQ